jgi:hypothetical protein
MRMITVDQRTFREWADSLPVPSCPVHGTPMAPSEGEEWGGADEHGCAIEGYALMFLCPVLLDPADENSDCLEASEEFELVTKRAAHAVGNGHHSSSW